MIRLTRDVIDYHALTEQVRRADCGAVVLFLGTVRDLTGERRHRRARLRSLSRRWPRRRWPRSKRKRGSSWPVGDMVMEHRLGHLDVGDVSVAVAVSCPHRAQAFEACRYAIDRLKELVPIWKKENWADGSTEWVHPGNMKLPSVQHPR